MQTKLPRDLLARIQSIKAKRPRTVLQHILSHGHITTEELKKLYGYDHPPRAARDVREQGIPLETFKVESSTGRKIAAYRLDLRTAPEHKKAGGRLAFSKKVKESLIEQYGVRCAICGAGLEPRYLQVDHRVPYEVAGESQAMEPDSLMLLCASCNRAKSWSCEHCKNWLEIKEIKICKSCYWAKPDSHEHVAMLSIRRADMVWLGSEVQIYDKLRAECNKSGMDIQGAIKIALAKLLK